MDVWSILRPVRESHWISTAELRSSKNGSGSLLLSHGTTICTMGLNCLCLSHFPVLSSLVICLCFLSSLVYVCLFVCSCFVCFGLLFVCVYIGASFCVESVKGTGSEDSSSVPLCPSFIVIYSFTNFPLSLSNIFPTPLSCL